VNVHKVLPALFAAGSQETVRATDFPKAVHDWPKLSFCAYHSAYFTSADDHPEGKVGLTEWLEVLASIPKKERRRVYSEIGSSFAIVLAQGPDAAAHFMGQLLKALGPRNILWGTDSIWWGSPQWLIDAFKALTIPEEMQERFRVSGSHRADEAIDPRAQLGASLRGEAQGGALHVDDEPARGVPGRAGRLARGPGARRARPRPASRGLRAAAGGEAGAARATCPGPPPARLLPASP